MDHFGDAFGGTNSATASASASGSSTSSSLTDNLFLAGNGVVMFDDNDEVLTRSNVRCLFVRHGQADFSSTSSDSSTFVKEEACQSMNMFADDYGNNHNNNNNNNNKDMNSRFVKKPG